ncbi:MAG TPA: GvpL/GvpF family gas vesicle protein [Vicinamibacterales bacterium]|nr:GvpL/GvpF family gas vesicle protein [Vicinamibacterales bacterium]
MMVVLAIADARDAKRAGVEAVTVKSLAAIVQKRSKAPAVSERALKAQAAALATLEAQGLAFLPVRFGTVVRDEAELTRLLTPMAASMKKALSLTRGRRQMTVRVRGTRAKTPRTSGRAFLAARVREARIPEADPVRKAVAGLVTAEETGPARGPFCGTVYHLVEDRHIARYMSAVEAVQRRTPGRFVVSGPMPPFAFTTVAAVGAGA